MTITEAQVLAAEAVWNAIVRQDGNRRERLRPMINRFDPVGSTGDVDFQTRKRTVPTEKSEVSHVTLDGKDGNTWEQLLASELELNRNVKSYVKNDHLGFTIPYVHKGRSHSYTPDFLVRLEPGDDGDRAHPDRRGLRQPEEPRADPPEGDHRARLLVRRGQQPRRLRPLGLHRDDRPARVQGAPRRRDPGAVRRQRRSSATPTGSTSSWQAMARKATKQAGPTPVDSIKHGDKRTNIPTADAHAFVDPAIEEVRKVRYARDESLDPQLVWRGKYPPADEIGEADLDLVTDAPPIYIQEKIDPRVLIENLRRTAEQARGRAGADALRVVRRPRRARPGRLLQARRQLVEPDDPRRQPPGDGVTRRAGEAPRQGADDLHRPAVRHQVRLELAGVGAQPRRQGRQARGRRPRGRADQGVPRHLGARHPLLPVLPARPAARRARPAHRVRLAASSRSATRTSTWFGA